MSRQKVFDDPLMMGFNADTPTTVPAARASVSSDSAPDEGLRSIDTTKVNLKEKKSKAAEPIATGVDPGPQASCVSSPKTSDAGKGLGFGVSLWDNKPAASSRQFDDLFDVPQSKFIPKVVEPDLFGSVMVENVEKFSRKLPQESSGRFKVSVEENDDVLTDLKIGKITEKEDQLDYNLFGKAQVVQGGRSRVLNEAAISNIKKEDLEVESHDMISQLEEATVEKKVPATVFTRPSFVHEESAPAASPTDDLDLSKLDLDAYINAQSGSSGGGLFD